MVTNVRTGDTAAMDTTRASDSDLRSAPLPVEVHFRGRPRDPSIARLAAERIGRTLARFRGRVASALVRVRDVNADRGGVDQLCSIELALAGGGRIYVTEQADRVERAIARLTPRVRRLLAERHRRRRT